MNNSPEVNPNMAFGGQQQPVSKSDPAAMMKNLQAILTRFEISIAEANDLVVLEDYEMVVIADDSGSMLNSSVPVQDRVLGQKTLSRWEELKATLGEIIEIAACFDQNGIDIFFLNRAPIEGIKTSKDQAFVAAFEHPPKGPTPLTETLERVATKVAGEKPVLLFILTDGEPNGGRKPFTSAIRRLIDRTGSKKLRVQIMACTADEEEMAWLNDLDHDLHIDVTDDYYAEKKEVLKAGLAPKFSRGDWCMKAMLGAVSPKFDKWDERLGHRHHGSGRGTPQCELCAIL